MNDKYKCSLILNQPEGRDLVCLSLCLSVSQDTVLTLEAITEYSRVVPHAVLNQDIKIRYSRKGTLGQVQLSQSRPVATPIQVRQVAALLCFLLSFPLSVSFPSQVTKDDDITVSTGYGTGVSNVKVGVVQHRLTP